MSREERIEKTAISLCNIMRKKHGLAPAIDLIAVDDSDYWRQQATVAIDIADKYR